MEQELRELAQLHVEHIQELRWSDLRRAVVLHLENMPAQDMRLQERLPNREVCPHILHGRPCCTWEPGTACSARWHPEFLQVLEDGASKWIWEIICRTHQRSLGNPNCV